MKRVIGCTALLCLLALTVGCGGTSSTGTRAYISNSTGTGFTVFNVNTNGTLTASSISPQNTPAAPKVIQFTPNGKWAYFLDNAGANIYAYTRAGNGSLATFIDSYPVTGGASSLVISANSMFLYVALPGALNGELAVFAIDQGTGILTQVGSNLLVGYVISELIMAPNGSVLYALAPTQQAVVTFPLNPSTGIITGTNAFSVGPTPPNDGMILSANGSFLYVLDETATGSFVNVATGAVGQSPTFFAFSTSGNGILSVIPGQSTPGVFHENADLILQTFPQEPVAGATSNDSRYLFIANQQSHNISVFRLGTTSGEPTEILGSVTTVNGIAVSTQSPFDCGSGCSTPSFVAVAHANNALYVLDTAADRIFQFAIDQNTGKLRALSPASVAAESGPTWITIR
jgi:6-phosphogluconolactonase (cycloisomerase 2 family)